MAQRSFRTNLAAAVALSLGGLSAAEAKPADDVPKIEFEQYRLDNGLDVILHPDNSVPLVAVDLWYHVGSGDEVVGKSGFAHLFEHMMFQGARHIGRDVHFDLLRRIGGTNVNGSTNTDRTNYYEVVPSHQLETALWLESDRMGYLLDLLDQKSLDNQIDVVRNERRQRYDNVPYGQDRFAVAAALYPKGHPHRFLTIGRHEDIDNASLEDVRGFFRKWYVPSNATLVLSGDFELEQGKALVAKWFGSYPALPRPERVPAQLPALTDTVRTQIQDRFARYPRIHYAWHSPAKLAEGDSDLAVAARILGSGGWGRLYKLLVVERQLAQSISVYQRGLGHNGEFHLVVNIKPGHQVSEVEPLLATELKKIIEEPVTEVEVRRAVARIEAGFVWGLEEVLTRAERLQFFNHYAGDPGYTAEYLRDFRARTPSTIAQAVRRVLDRPRVEVITLPAPDEKSDDKGGS